MRLVRLACGLIRITKEVAERRRPTPSETRSMQTAPTERTAPIELAAPTYALFA